MRECEVANIQCRVRIKYGLQEYAGISTWTNSLVIIRLTRCCQADASKIFLLTVQPKFQSRVHKRRGSWRPHISTNQNNCTAATVRFCLTFQLWVAYTQSWWMSYNTGLLSTMGTHWMCQVFQQWITFHMNAVLNHQNFVKCTNF